MQPWESQNLNDCLELQGQWRCFSIFFNLEHSSEEENVWTLRDPVYRHGPVFCIALALLFISSLVQLSLYWLLRLHLFIYVFVCVWIWA